MKREQIFNNIMDVIDINNHLVYTDINDMLSSDDELELLTSVNCKYIDFTDLVKNVYNDLNKYCIINNIEIIDKTLTSIVIDFIQLVIHFGYDVLMEQEHSYEDEYNCLNVYSYNYNRDIIQQFNKLLCINLLSNKYNEFSFVTAKLYNAIPNKNLYYIFPYNYRYVNGKHLFGFIKLYGDKIDEHFKK